MCLGGGMLPCTPLRSMRTTLRERGIPHPPWSGEACSIPPQQGSPLLGASRSSRFPCLMTFWLHLPNGLCGPCSLYMLRAPSLLSRTYLALRRRYPGANPQAGWPPVIVKSLHRVRAETSISCPLQLVYCSPFSHTKRSSLCEESTGLVRRSVLRSLLLSPIGGKPSTDALLSAESARLPLAIALLQVTGDVPLRWHTAGDLDACAGERAPHNWCIMLPVSQRVQPGVYTLMALSRYRDALVQQVGPERPLVYQPLVPQILTACYQVVLLPPRDFGAWPPVARDVYYAVALFLQVRAAHPDLIQKHRGAGSLLLTPPLDTQATFAKLFADIGVDDDIRYARIEELLRHGPPAPASITARHVQALWTDLRAETLSHAAGLTSHTTLLGLW